MTTDNGKNISSRVFELIEVNSVLESSLALTLRFPNYDPISSTISSVRTNTGNSIDSWSCGAGMVKALYLRFVN